MAWPKVTARLADAMGRSRAQLEPVVGTQAARYTPWASLCGLVAFVVGFLLALPAYFGAVTSKSPVLIGLASLFGLVFLMAIGAAWLLLVKVNRAASRYVSAQLGSRLHFWGAYATADAWERAIRRKAGRPRSDSRHGD
jgi:hypothetical protein